MRIVHYYRDLARPSGVTHAISEWQRALEKAGTATVALHSGPVELTDWPGPSLAIRHVGRGRQTQVPLLSSHLRSGDVLVLHEGWVTSNLVAAYTCRRLGVPYVIVPHGVYDPNILPALKPPLALRFSSERRVIADALAVHVFFPSERPLVSAIADPQRFIVAPTGFDTPGTVWAGGGDYIGWFGRYSVHHKGIDLLLRSYAAIDASVRLPLRLHGPDYHGGRRQTEALVQELGLADVVTVGDALSGNEKWQFLASAEAVVFPSRWESHSIALLEALAIGAPTVVSNTVHASAGLSASSAAIVVDMSNPLDAARGVVAAQQNGDLGRRGADFVRQEFDWDEVARKFLGQLRQQLDPGTAA